MFLLGWLRCSQWSTEMIFGVWWSLCLSTRPWPNGELLPSLSQEHKSVQVGKVNQVLLWAASLVGPRLVVSSLHHPLNIGFLAQYTCNSSWFWLSHSSSCSSTVLYWNRRIMLMARRLLALFPNFVAQGCIVPGCDEPHHSLMQMHSWKLLIQVEPIQAGHLQTSSSPPRNERSFHKPNQEQMVLLCCTK